MAGLEGPDELITLEQAAAIAGITKDTLRQAAAGGRLDARRIGHNWLTTRRKLHRYLAGRKRGVVKPLPPDYVTPEGEEPIG
jgi:excisionase family DNA binding protein